MKVINAKNRTAKFVEELIIMTEGTTFEEDVCKIEKSLKKRIEHIEVLPEEEAEKELDVLNSLCDEVLERMYDRVSEQRDLSEEFELYAEESEDVYKSKSKSKKKRKTKSKQRQLVIERILERRREKELEKELEKERSRGRER